MILAFKKRNKYPINKTIELKDVLNIKNLAIGAINNKKYNNSLKSNFEELLLDFKIKNKNIITKLNISFERKNKQYNKMLYVTMTEEMEKINFS